MVIWCDMVCLALALAPSCAALHFWCLYIMLSKSYLPRRCDWKDGFFYKSLYTYTTVYSKANSCTYIYTYTIHPHGNLACSLNSTNLWLSASGFQGINLKCSFVHTLGAYDFKPENHGPWTSWELHFSAFGQAVGIHVSNLVQISPR